MANKTFDVTILGGGAAGIMAALSIKEHHPQKGVCMLEKNSVIGRKILICGAGRCNLTNSNIDLNRYYGANKKFIASVVNQFNSKDIMNYFNNLGVDLYEEEKNGRKKGKIFPKTNEAKTITELLKSEIDRQGVSVFTNCEVESVEKKVEQFCVNTKITNEDETTFPESFESEYLILALGGKTYPQLGATGFGYNLALAFGHSIIKPVPSALPLETEGNFAKHLSGVRVDAEITSLINGKKVKSDIDQLMFTDYGISGPATLNISREISIRINREEINDCEVIINFFPGKNIDSVISLLKKRWEERKNQKVLFSLFGLIPNKVASEIMRLSEINLETLNKDLTKKQIFTLAQNLNELKLKVSNTRTWKEGEFTAGGINTNEVKESLESKIIPNLYFAGEILNVDGDVGGFNLTWAWSSGHKAGMLS